MLTRLYRPSSLAVLVLLLPWLGAGRASAQTNFGDLPRTMPDELAPDDVNEVDDLDRFGDEPGSVAERRTNAGKSNTKVENEVLGYSANEIRSRFAYLGSVAAGETVPWQTYTVQMDALLRPDFTVGLAMGGGHFSTDGNTVNQRSYNSVYDCRGASLTARYWIHRLDILSLEGSVGYSTWNGSVSPHGSDDQKSASADKLESSFQGDGYTGSLALAFSWLWNSGFYLEWLPVGVVGSHIQHLSFGEENPTVRQVIERDTQRGRVFGLVNLKVGWFF